MKLAKLYMALACTVMLGTGCMQQEQPKEPAPAVDTLPDEDAAEDKNNEDKDNSSDHKEDASGEDVKEADWFELKRLYYPVMEDGIDYLSVAGINIPEKTDIALIGKESKSTFWEQVKKGAEDAVADMNAELGYTKKDKIKFTYAAPAKEDVIEQINIIDQFLDKAPDVLGVAFSDAGACATQMELAKNNGVVLFAVDSADSGQMTEGFCATDNKSAARDAAVKLFDAVGQDAKVALIAHSSVTQTGLERSQEIIDVKNISYSDRNIQLVEISYAAQAEKTEAEVLAEVLKNHPDLDGVICTNQNTTEAVIDYVKGLENVDFTIVGFDASEKILNAVESGLVLGTIAQDPYGMGYASVVAMARKMAGMQTAGEIYSGYCWIDQGNLEQEDVQCLLNY